MNVDASHITPLRGNISCFDEFIFFQKDEKPHYTIRTDVLGTVETQVDYCEK
jgi:hypothetical protein